MRIFSLSILLLLLCGSCKQEISQEEFRSLMNKQCMERMAMVYMSTENHSLEELKAFCDCYADFIIGENEVMTVEVIEESMKVQEHVVEALSKCATESEKKDEDTPTETPDSTKVQQETHHTE